MLVTASKLKTGSDNAAEVVPTSYLSNQHGRRRAPGVV